MRLAELQARIGSMGELRDIVGAMRSLAGMRALEAQHALPAVRRYAETMARAIGAALTLLPEARPGARPGHGRRALIVFTAEHGFVGGFNERLAAAVDAVMTPQDVLFVLGSRGAALLHERGRRAAWTRPMATRSASVPETVRLVAAELYARIGRGEIACVEMIHARHRQTDIAPIERHPLLPLEPSAFAVASPHGPPLHNMDPGALLEALMAHYVIALLTEAAVESIASENAARFSAMEAAHQNVSKKLEQLQQSAQQVRQAEITTELLDLVTGAEALRARDAVSGSA